MPAGVLTGLLAMSANAQPSTEIVEVVGQTPLGADIGAAQVAANVQQAGADAIDAQRVLDLSEYMRRNLGSVFVNEAQSNPLQPDVRYRGFVGSPLLGLPQGLAVYQDGVRLNEPFGDTLNWALLPNSAVETMSLAPGSNPLFGLNALGGAISIRTRNGFTSEGTTGRAYAGSFGRLGLRAATGGADEKFAYFVTGEYLDEDGWRDYSPTEATQLFGKLSWRANATEIHLGLSLAETDLIGNGAAPIELLAIDRHAIFTRPDQTENELGMVNLTVDRAISEEWQLMGNVYLRSSDIRTLNGDDSEYQECIGAPALLCEADEAAEELVFDENDAPVPALSSLQGAVVNRTSTLQDGAGFGLQMKWEAEPGRRTNTLLFGLMFDDSSIAFDSSSELGSLDATRLAIPGGVFVGDSFTRLNVETSNIGLYISNTFGLSESVALTISGRYNDTEIGLRDQLGTALDGDHDFRRLNPAVGLTAALGDTVALYARYSESTRAPSPVELTCADPGDPCRLPNAFLADPPLDQVVAHTLEAGLRSDTNAFNWHAGLFRTTNHDDILFISAGARTNQGFFDNIGRTRREGVEINLSGSARSLRWFANYSLVDATFREHLRLPSPNSPSAIAGEITVRPGDSLPLIPRHTVQAGLDALAGSRFGLGASVTASSGFHFRGDEANDTPRIGRQVVVNLRADYALGDRFSLFLTIDNVFDRNYESFGLFGDAEDVLGSEYTDHRFISPGAPRAAFVGMQVDLR